MEFLELKRSKGSGKQNLADTLIAASKWLSRKVQE